MNQELDAIKARLLAATPGPWKVDEVGNVEDVPEFDLHRFDIMPNTIARVELSLKDADLIAHAPTDLARLIAAVEAAAEALAKHGNPSLCAIVHQYITQALEGK